VEELIGSNTVNTMPPKTIEAFLDHGRVEDTLERDVEDAQKTLDQFAEAGVDYDDVVETLEREGVEKFAKSFSDLIEGVNGKREQLVAA
jgi:transaldolase